MYTDAAAIVKSLIGGLSNDDGDGNVNGKKQQV